MSVIIEKDIEFKLEFDEEELINKIVKHISNYFNNEFVLQVNVLLTDNENIHKINKEYRNIDSETDVLSFPAIEYEIPGDLSFIDEDDVMYFDLDTDELIFGDIILSIDRVKTQAKEYGHSEYREFAFLITHSMLHLFGFDHIEESDREIMEAHQKKIMDELEIYR